MRILGMQIMTDDVKDLLTELLNSSYYSLHLRESADVLDMDIRHI